MPCFRIRGLFGGVLAKGLLTPGDVRVVLLGLWGILPRRDAFIKNTVSICAASVVALLDVSVGVRYCVKVVRKQAYPRIATWLIFEIGVVMSLAAYFASRDHSLLKAALNVTDGFVVTVIVLALLLAQRGEKIAFTRNEGACLLLSCVTLAAWAVTKTAWLGFVGFQVVMVVAYLPTIESMWRWHPGPSPEPADMWGVSAAEALLGVLVDVTGKHDYVAMLYPLRAFVLCMAVVGLLGRWSWKSRMADRVTH